MNPVAKTVGELLIDLLVAQDVEVVFGIPGVHTVELYRGLAGSSIRHITPRHEQGAAFMADGYARVSGKPGVCLVITGPGVTNTITAMAQARADSVPMLVISGVNRRAALGHGRGALHELPDQRALMKSVALHSHTLLDGADLPDVVQRAFGLLESGRPGPIHIEIPVDVMAERVSARVPPCSHPFRPTADRASLEKAAALCRQAARPVIIAGGGARRTGPSLRELAERLDAPVVTTTNGRGLLADRALVVPASPSMKAVRGLLAEADLVIAVGTEFGPTDFDMYEDGGFPELARLIRIDIDRDQLTRGPRAELAILSSAESALEGLLSCLDQRRGGSTGASRAAATREAAFAELPPEYHEAIGLIRTIQDVLPGAIIVGDSTQPVYAGNLMCEVDTPGAWFNSATGFGALGYAAPAAIGAKLAAPDRPVVCLTGDGGLQFTLAEIGAAMDAEAPVIFLVWNNHGYREIEQFMVAQGIEPEGVRPSAPDFVKVAQAYGMDAARLMRSGELADALSRAAKSGRPALLEMIRD